MPMPIPFPPFFLSPTAHHHHHRSLRNGRRKREMPVTRGSVATTTTFFSSPPFLSLWKSPPPSPSPPRGAPAGKKGEREERRQMQRVFFLPPGGGGAMTPDFNGICSHRAKKATKEGRSSSKSMEPDGGKRKRRPERRGRWLLSHPLHLHIPHLAHIGFFKKKVPISVAHCTHPNL